MVGISPKKLGSSSPKIAPRENRNEWARPLAVVWLAALVYAAFLIRTPYAAPLVLFDPLHALKLFLKADGLTFLKRLGYLEGAGLNILLFVPFGYLLPMLWKRADRWWKVLLCGFAASLVIELLQLVTRYGMFDLDDLINNSLGALLGWSCYARWLAGSCR